MKLSEFCIRRPIFTMMLIASLVVFGVTSYWSLGIALFPDVDFGIVSITVVYEGASPETVETEVTDKIEEAVNTISGIKTLSSQSAEGLAQILVQFELEQDIDVASQDIREKVAQIRGDLPLDIQSPVIAKFDPDASPIMSLLLSGPTSIRELTRYADDKVKPRIEGIDGVGSVSIVGGRDREIRVWLRVDDLRKYSLSAQDVIDTLQQENVEFPGGRVEGANRELVIRTQGNIERVDEFSELVIAYRDRSPVRIRDVALVEDGEEDARSLSRYNGDEAVSLLIRRQSGKNLVAVAQAVNDQFEQIKATLPEGYRIKVVQDLSTFVNDSYQSTQDELIRGATLAVLVILLFLRNIRGALVAATTIPTTIIATLSFIHFMGFTLNILSMLGLSISVGMIIDDSIVVLENSFRHMEEGKSRMRAAFEGISEIGFAVVATSLAIGAVFVPVAFMTGLIGQFFYEFGLTVSFAVAVSTFIALTLSPMLCSRILKLPKKHGSVFNVIERAFRALESIYHGMLRFALGWRFTVMGAALLVFVGSMSLTALIGKEFQPPQDEGEFNVQIETPLGSSIERTSKIVEQIEKNLRSLPLVTSTFTTIGSDSGGQVNVATVLVQLKPKDERDLTQQDVMVQARDLLAGFTNCKISVENPARISVPGARNSPIQFNLRGPDFKVLDEQSQKIIAGMKAEPGIVDVASSYDPEKPEIMINIDRDRAADLGVSARDLGKTVRALVGGQEVTTFEEDGEAYDVRMRLVASDRTETDAALALPVRGRYGSVELGTFVEVEEGTGPVQIDREARQRQITIMANLEASKPLGAATTDVERIAREANLPPEVSTAFTGMADMMAESFEAMFGSLFLAIILIYMILAAQFESFVHPFTIMLSLPLSVGGALGGLFLTGRTLNIFSMIGMIMLMGLVTKNAILLIDYTNRLRDEGMSKDDALMRAGPVRLRPILMTAFSTIAGMIPITLGLGEGAETRAPMGTCVVGGMITSTLLTLIVVPVMYSLMDDLGHFARRLFSGRREDHLPDRHAGEFSHGNGEKSGDGELAVNGDGYEAPPVDQIRPFA